MKPLQTIAYEIFEDLTTDSWGNDPRFQALTRSEQIRVSRIINNIIREEYY